MNAVLRLARVLEKSFMVVEVSEISSYALQATND